MRNPYLRELAWIAVPLAAYLFILQRLWFNVPILDDYDAVVWWPMKMMDAKSLGEWLRIIVEQHNEHRIAVVRFAAWAMAMMGQLDFRMLVLLGNLTLVGFFFLAYLEFRRDVAAPIFCAAALVMFQWSYYEASLMASAALPNIGAATFSLACLFFALRGGLAGAAACLFFALLAVGSQASGLLALPVAVVACFLAKRYRRAALFAAVAAVLWGAYFINYYKPGGHPPLLAALASPIDAARLYFVVIGGIASWGSEVPGAILLATIAWLVHRRFWREHPTAALWIAYILLSAAAVTVGRAGFGVHHASRYAIYSSCLAVVVLLSVCSETRLTNRAMIAAVVAWCFIASLLASWMSWPAVRAYAGRGHDLTKVVAMEGETGTTTYLGIAYPVYAHARHQLIVAEQRHLYVPPRQLQVHASTVSVNASDPLPSRIAGNVDEVIPEGARLRVKGWTDLTPYRASRVFAVHGAPAPEKGRVLMVPREDVATVTRIPDLILSGFEMELDYASADEAKRAAPGLCLAVTAPEAIPRQSTEWAAPADD